MKRNLVAIVLAVLLSFPYMPLQGVDAPPEAPPCVPAETDATTGRVGRATGDGCNAAETRHWQNIALAVGAVLIATTAILLASTNSGHSSNSPGLVTHAH